MTHEEAKKMGATHYTDTINKAYVMIEDCKCFVLVNYYEWVKCESKLRNLKPL